MSGRSKLPAGLPRATRPSAFGQPRYCAPHPLRTCDAPPRARKNAQADSPAFALAYRALPAAVLPPIGTKPVRPSAFRAALTASAQALILLPVYACFAKADLLFDTTLPCRFFTKLALVRPPIVFSLRPENTEDLALRPAAITLTFLAFMAFPPAFMAPAFFIGATFFMGSAMLGWRGTGRRPAAGIARMWRGGK